ncbi:Retrotransposable element Tf2 [Cucumis melo var. makuwa]|uniref:Retrotransposable element Tf2 n=1 Tax=Cucumis melo var. makuwa TaxID=1194695 RepID=A0A5D3D8C1_CUCMM|nr:Retrotransposable element Tf2 [Cucumis melo var. makuwa]
MSAENYAMDIQFEQVSRCRQGSSPRALSIQTGPSSLPPYPSTTLLRPSGVSSPNKHAASPAASFSKSPISRNSSSFSQLGPSDNFKALSKALRIKWWEKFDYSHLEVNKMKDWFKANIHLQDLTRREDEAFLLTKNVIMSSLIRTGFQEEFNSVVNTVAVQISNPDDSQAEVNSPASVNNVIEDEDDDDFSIHTPITTSMIHF